MNAWSMLIENVALMWLSNAAFELSNAAFEVVLKMLVLCYARNACVEPSSRLD